MQPLLAHLPHAAHLVSKQTTYVGMTGMTVLLFEFSDFLSVGVSATLLPVGITWAPNESPPQAN